MLENEDERPLERLAEPHGAKRGLEPMLMGEGSPSRPLSVLLVEDSTTNQVLAATLLAKKGHTVETAQTGKEALAALASRAFDVVFMDVEMPEMDGFETTARIRAQELSTGEHVPILAMTAHATKDDRQRCLEAGMDGYVSKPIHARELYQALATLTPAKSVPAGMTCTRGPAECALARHATHARTHDPSAARPAEIIDKAALLARVGGREDRLRTIVQIFLEESSNLMAELSEAITRGEASRLQRAAHSLQGAVGIFGAPDLVDAAVTLESLGQAVELTGAIEAYSRLAREFRKLKSALTGFLSQSSGDPSA
jgi:CheY-like chemotaxis protein/HPt (histidine-containing phosphotransfer) domain-containing protein